MSTRISPDMDTLDGLAAEWDELYHVDGALEVDLATLDLAEFGCGLIDDADTDTDTDTDTEGE